MKKAGPVEIPNAPHGSSSMVTVVAPPHVKYSVNTPVQLALQNSSLSLLAAAMLQLSKLLVSSSSTHRPSNEDMSMSL